MLDAIRVIPYNPFHSRFVIFNTRSLIAVLSPLLNLYVIYLILSFNQVETALRKTHSISNTDFE